jgi:ABC-2 type transport system ATP-binding protein
VTDDAVIAVDRLTKRFAGVDAVDDLSFTVPAGRIVGFLGPNGAGKTTTLRMLLGLVRASSGTATVLGRRYADLARPWETVGAVLESSAAHPGRTGRNHLRVLCTVTRLPHKRADELLDRVGLTGAADRKVGQYSLGMRQRLALAAALLGDPPVLILDEPVNGLDPDGIRWLRRLLRDLADEGRTVLVSSHLLAEVQAIADHVVIIAAGRLVQQGPLADVVGAVGWVRVRTPQPQVLTAALNAAGGAVTTSPDGALMVAGLSRPDIAATARAAEADIHELVEAGPDLEQVFLDLTSNQGEAS